MSLRAGPNKSAQPEAWPGDTPRRLRSASDRKQFAVECREHFAQLLLGGQHGFHDFDEFGHAFDKLTDSFVELDHTDDTDLQSKVPQQTADVVLNGDGLVLQNLASGQQGPTLLAGQRLHVHRSKQIDAHHLSNAARVVLVHLGLEESLRMPGFNAGHRQSGFRQAAEQPLRQGSRFQADALELLCGIVERRNQILGMGRNFHLSADFACLFDDAYRCLFDRTAPVLPEAPTLEKAEP